MTASRILNVVPAMLFSAFVCAKLWAWFVVPAFGWQALSVYQVIGLRLAIRAWQGMPTITSTDPNKRTVEKVWDIVGVHVFFAMVLGIAAAVRCFQ